MVNLYKKVGDFNLTTRPTSDSWVFTNNKGISVSVFAEWHKNEKRFYQKWYCKINSKLNYFPTDEMALNYAYRFMENYGKKWTTF